MAEFEEIFEDFNAGEELSGLDEMGNIGDRLNEAEAEALNKAEAEAEQQFQDFSEAEIEKIDASSPEEMQAEVEKVVNNDDVAEMPEEQEQAARDEGMDPEKPKANLKTRLKKVWKQYGSFLKGIGEFSVKALGEYFKWKFISEGTKHEVFFR